MPYPQAHSVSPRSCRSASRHLTPSQAVSLGEKPDRRLSKLRSPCRPLRSPTHAGFCLEIPDGVVSPQQMPGADLS
jgi:hypothetical protein